MFTWISEFSLALDTKYFEIFEILLVKTEYYRSSSIYYSKTACILVLVWARGCLTCQHGFSNVMVSFLYPTNFSIMAALSYLTERSSWSAFLYRHLFLLRWTGHSHDDVVWLQLPECFASTLYLLALGCWQSILVVVVIQRYRTLHNPIVQWNSHRGEAIYKY